MLKITQTCNKGEKSVFMYIPNFLDENDIEELSTWLNKQTYCSGTSNNGNEISRKQIWFQEDEKYFCSKWKNRYERWMGTKYPELLYKIQNKVQAKLGTTDLFNSCLINLYRNGMDKITPHKDSPDSFGIYPTIVNLSVGATRILRVSNKDEEYNFSLEHNSLFIMSGASQKYYVHEIIEDSKITESRYSLTFRKLL